MNAVHDGLAVLMVGAAVDAPTMQLLHKVDWLAQVQTYRFNWALIGAIELGLGRPIDVISTVPTRDFPFSRKIFWPAKRVARGSGGVLRIMPLMNLLGLKQISRFCGSAGYALAWLWRNRRQQRKVVISYGLIVPHLLALLPLCRFFGAKLVPVVTDPPMNYWDEGWLYRVARWADRTLLKAAIRRVDGLVTLTPALAELLAPRQPSVVVEAIISGEVEEYAKQKKPGVERQRSEAAEAFVIMYAGQLVENYGLRILLKAFERLEGERYALWICGQGDLEDEIRRAAEQDRRITFFGNVGPERLFPRMEQASVMVNPRPPDQRIAPYSFPSKVLEYLALGKLIVSARLAGIPGEYHPHLILVDPMDEHHLADTLRNLASQDAARRRAMEDGARQFAWSCKTQACQGRRIVEFLRTLA